VGADCHRAKSATRSRELPPLPRLGDAKKVVEDIVKVLKSRFVISVLMCEVCRLGITVPRAAQF
jgi:hypothetical protein